jgi:hypothetical protein
VSSQNRVTDAAAVRQGVIDATERHRNSPKRPVVLVRYFVGIHLWCKERCLTVSLCMKTTALLFLTLAALLPSQGLAQGKGKTSLPQTWWHNHRCVEARGGGEDFACQQGNLEILRVHSPAQCGSFSDKEIWWSPILVHLCAAPQTGIRTVDQEKQFSLHHLNPKKGTRHVQETSDLHDVSLITSSIRKRIWMRCGGVMPKWVM